MSVRPNINGSLPDVTIQATGLNTSPNPLSIQEGSLKVASDVIIRRDNVIESRRGFALYGDTLGSNTDRCKQLAVYRDSIIRHYNNVLDFQNGTHNDGTPKFTEFAGNYTEVQTGLRMKSVEMNGNFYFTTNAGIYKISAAKQSDLTSNSNFITKSGGVKAVDLKAQLQTTQGTTSEFFTQDACVAYRAVWGTNDLNNNLILGTPSPYIQVYNPLLSLLLLDYVTILNILNDLNQTGSMFTYGNYANSWKLPSTATTTQLFTNIGSVCKRLDTDLYFANATGSGVPLTIAADLSYNFTNANVSGSIFNITNTFQNGYLVRFSNSTPANIPSPLVAGTDYWVVNVTGSSFQVSSIKGGSPITLTSTGSTGNTVSFYGALNDTGNEYVITFSSGTVTNYMSVGDYVNLSGFAIEGTGTTTINGQWKLTAVDSNSISFTVSSGLTGNNSTTSAQIHSYTYEQLYAGYTTPNIPPTNNDLTSIQNLLTAIINKLSSSSTSILSASLVAKYLTPFTFTTTSQVVLTINIPQDINSNYFLQLYRTKQVIAQQTDVLANLSPGDEEQQIYEVYPTAAQLAAGTMTITDQVTDAFLGNGAYLYTNQITGQGINQSNDVPPLSQDINVYKNYLFYANTQTRYKMLLTLLGIQNMISDYNGGTTPKVTIADSSNSSTYSFVPGVQQVTTITCQAVASVTDGSYFLINSANNTDLYYVWFYKGAGTDPAISGRIGIKVDLTVKTLSGGSISTASDVALRLSDVLATAINDFTTSVSSSTVTVTNVSIGYTSSPQDGTSPKNTTFTFTVTTSGKGELASKQTTSFTCVAESGGNYLNAGVGKYFTVNTAFDRNQYYVWFQVSGSGSDPAVSNRIGVKVSISTGDTATTIGSAIATVLNALTNQFTVTANSGTVTITNYYTGPCTAVTLGNSPLTTLTLVQAGALQVLLSNNVLASVAIDETARSLVRVINQNNAGDVYAFYLSGPADTPGQLYLESREVNNPIFYAVGNNTNTGASFKPALSPTFTSGSIATGNPAVVTITNHGFTNNQQVLISNTNSSPNADGIYTITYIDANTFSIPIHITTQSTTLSAILVSNAESGSNQVSPNRLYYSKLQQPEAVPALNYLDIGAQDKAIVRIYPLRDSLFIFKEDGIYRLSGEVAPFTVSLFDPSQKLIAPDSVNIVSNVIYGWTTQGITIVTESGANVISRNIDNQILPLTNANYPNFSTATFGIGYQSDSSYIMWTVKNSTDTVATIAYRYHTLTNTWTTYNKTNTCGILNPVDDKLYLGAGDTNSIEQERKTFSRLDYADRQYTETLSAGNLNESNISFPELTISAADISKYAAGDVVTQVQTVTPYKFNSLLTKLDNDQGLSYKSYSTFKANPGDSLRTDLLNLVAQLDLDNGLTNHNYTTYTKSLSGTISSNTAATSTVITTSTAHGLQSGRYIQITGSNCSPNMDGNYTVTVLSSTTFSIPFSITVPGTSGSWSTLDTDFNDIQGCFNIITTNLNADPGTRYKNYPSINSTTLVEAIITSINLSNAQLTLNLSLPFVQGPLTIYKAINSYFVYNPITFGDPLAYKQIRESQILLENKAFTSATVSFATDLLPAFIDVPITGDGNGIFGYQQFGQGFFGGGSNAAPFRTYVPRNCQRCRYLSIKFTHAVARENFSVLGFTLTGNIGISSRTYR